MTKYLLLIAALVATVGCRNHYQGEVVKETYEHKYGVPVSAADWEKQGQDGKVIQLRKDGVTVTHSYDHGVLNGVSSWTFSNSTTIQREEDYDQGKMVARREHYISGIPSREICYDQDGAATRRMRWYEDGTPAAIESYEQHLLTTGEYRTPLNLIGSKVSEGEGKRLMWDNEGQLIAEDKIVDGKLTERVEYYANGDPSVITPYVNDEIHGERLTFQKGGLPNTCEKWVCGKQEGATLVYLNGEKFAEVPYKDGAKHGIELRFRDGSLVVEEINWVNNLQHGSHKLFIDGSTKTEWYHHGSVVSRPTYERLNPIYAER
ncbi:MAG: hypothetical protein S4CHLAM45_00520 [Chlamydiales bacterium]|nr:hypothetical protein [Chlamydiales bacterium]MCH9619374.1 hypothetical protein [Chlamydiales bacterium]MCH9622178.1 hypothetical protein [Chlamydiales bacterium]